MKRNRKILLELTGEEIEFIAGELHQVRLGDDKYKRKKALEIGNKITEQLWKLKKERR